MIKVPFFQKSLVLWQFFHASKDLQDQAFPIDFLHISTEKKTSIFKNPDSYLVKSLYQFLCNCSVVISFTTFSRFAFRNLFLYKARKLV